MAGEDQYCGDLDEEDRYCGDLDEEDRYCDDSVEVHRAGWQALLGVVALCLAVAFAVFGPKVYGHFFPKAVNVRDFLERDGTITRVCLCRDNGQQSYEELSSVCHRECLK